jgi:hypothetical protein
MSSGHTASNRRMPDLLNVVAKPYPTDSAAFRKAETPRQV